MREKTMKTMDDLRNLFLQALQRETDYLKQELPSHLYAIINGYLQGGGKRLRPCLLLMCAQAAGGDVAETSKKRCPPPSPSKNSIHGRSSMTT